MDKRSEERHKGHRLIQVDESHIHNVVPINPAFRLHACQGHCKWTGWVTPKMSEEAS